MKRDYTATLPTIPRLMAEKFPEVEYEYKTDMELQYLATMKVKYHNPKEIEQAIIEIIPAIYGVKVIGVKSFQETES